MSLQEKGSMGSDLFEGSVEGHSRYLVLNAKSVREFLGHRGGFLAFRD